MDNQNYSNPTKQPILPNENTFNDYDKMCIRDSIGSGSTGIALSCREDMDHHCFIVCFICITMD